MMLLGSLFFLEALEKEGEEIRATLKVNQNHGILAGHFPGFPVMPGVCMIQVVREVFEKATGIAVRITNGDNIKFLAVLEPGKHRNVRLQIDFEPVDSAFEIVASIVSGEVDQASGSPITFFKFKGIYRAESTFAG